MIKNTLIIALVAYILYLHYQQRQNSDYISVNPVDFNEKWKEIEKDLEAKFQQNYQSQLTNYEAKVKRLEEQIKTYQKGDDWETKTAEVIKNLEEEVSDLTTERDEAIRDKKTLEQETISLSNKLKLKSQETTNKDNEIQRLKKEKSQSEIVLNKTITELKKKHSEREKLLDEEQTENNKLTKQIESLEETIKSLQGSKSPLPGSWDYEEELEKELKEKEKTHQEQLRTIAQELAEETLPTEISLELVLDLAKKKKTNRAGDNLQKEINKVTDFQEWLSKDAEQEKLFNKVDWDYYQNREDWITDFQNWNRLQPTRIELLKKWLAQND